MNIGVPSRFACLKIEDDDIPPPKPQENRKKGDNNKNLSSRKPDKAGPKEASKRNTKEGNHSKKDKKKEVSEKQWREWKEKDNVLVDDQYEGDLQYAILQSKLEYEQNKKHREANEQDAGKKNKKKKNKTVSLSQFLGNNKGNSEQQSDETPAKDDKFFDHVALEAKEVLNKERIIAERKEREENIEERITIAQYEEKLEEEKAKNLKLQKEVEFLKEELKTVKLRNKSLCDMLGNGEMKDKVDVLKELERLNSVKNELTDEVGRLYGLLEQERSKVASLTDVNKHKDKGKKQ